MFREPKFDRFSGKRMSSPSRDGDVGRKGTGGGRMRGQGSGGCQGWRAHCFQQEELQVRGEG